jgi:hypothetical protein
VGRKRDTAPVYCPNYGARGLWELEVMKPPGVREVVPGLEPTRNQHWWRNRQRYGSEINVSQVP